MAHLTFKELAETCDRIVEEETKFGLSGWIGVFIVVGSIIGLVITACVHVGHGLMEGGPEDFDAFFIGFVVLSMGLFGVWSSIKLILFFARKTPGWYRSKAPDISECRHTIR